MSFYLSFDTSNYTTSAAILNSDTGAVIHRKKLLPVKQGECGIRQSDAVFHHTQQLREIVPALMEEAERAFGIGNLQEIRAVGVSAFPRRVQGSYMPCFTVGLTAGHTVAAVLGVPCYEFSHQEGHIAAALYSADKLSLAQSDFLAFHVSGGTTESLLVTQGSDSPVEASLLGTSTDLKAGQAIDRVGVMLGLGFPCGPALEKLALSSSRTFQIKPSANGKDCSFSGVENKCRKMVEDGEAPEDVALFCLKYIEAGILHMSRALVHTYPGLPLVFSGGVMSNSIIKETLLKEASKYNFKCFFATPEFSSDNAVGTAVLSALKEGSLWSR